MLLPELYSCSKMPRAIELPYATGASFFDHVAHPPVAASGAVLCMILH